MELPHLGKNCALRECNQLDFLPVKCDACSEIFCVRHYQYDNHNCEKAKNKNVQVPVCPLCSEPVVSRRNELPDIAVSHHIDQYCKLNDRLKAPKPRSNLRSCSFESCKQKDLIYLECKDCRSKFCIKHRHPSDHSCVGPSMTANISDNWKNFKSSCSNNASSSFAMIKNKAQQTSKSGQAALNRIANRIGSTSSDRQRNQFPSNQAVSSLQGNLSEQEALAIALNESKGLNNHGTTTGTSNTSGASSQQQQEEDLALARAIQESELEARRRNGQANNTRDACIVG